MDLVSTALLSLFAAAAAGGALGFLVARAGRFEIGLAVGLLVFGAVALAFAARCFLEYRDFAHAGANAAWGEVIAIEDRRVNVSGSITSRVAVVRFVAPDRTMHVVRGPGGSAAVGSHVNVVYDPMDPQRSRIGELGELRGGAIALLLFGTFPVSFGIWLLLATALGERGKAGGRRMAGSRSRPQRKQPAAAAAKTATDQPPGRLHGIVLAAFGSALACAILWIGLAPGNLVQNFVQGFTAIALVCAGYAAWGLASGLAGGAWSGGMLVLGLNFAVWAFALDLLG
jgi:hypothetical protein